MENGKLKIEANAGKRVQRALVRYAEQEHFRANEVWSIEANAGKRVQRALVRYAEQEHFRTNEVWSIENYAL